MTARTYTDGLTMIASHFQDRQRNSTSNHRVKAALRLRTDGGAKLILRPSFMFGRSIHGQSLRYEFWWKNPDKGWMIRRGIIGTASHYALHDSENFKSIRETLREFADNPAKVLRRSSDSCAICDRRLTDPVSQARGVGPECMKHVAWFVKEVGQC